MILVTFGQRLKQLRDSKGISMDKLAKAIGTSSSRISDWENEKTHPSSVFVVRIARFFGVSTDWLLTGEDYIHEHQKSGEDRANHNELLEMINFSKRLKKLRELKELSVDALSEKVGIASSRISDWENGKSFPSLPELVALSRFFAVSIDYLITGQDHMTEREFAANAIAADALTHDIFHHINEGNKIEKSALFKNFIDATIKWLKTEQGEVNWDPHAIVNLFKSAATLFGGPPVHVTEKDNTNPQHDKDELSPEERELVKILRQLDKSDQIEIMTIARMKKDIIEQYGKRKGGRSSISISEEAAASEKRYDKFA